MADWFSAMESLKNKTILVIGGTGFIGQHLIEKLQSLSSEVISISLSNNNDKTDNKHPDATYFSVDISDANALKKIPSNEFDYVVNLGGYIDHSPFENKGKNIINVHLFGLMNLVEFINKKTLKKFIQIGSSDEYGNNTAPQKEVFREMPFSPYSFSKACGTHFLQMLGQSDGFPSTVLRLFLVYGPGQHHERLIPQIIKGCLEDKEFSLSPGNQLRDFCYVGDVVEAIVRALGSKESSGNVINIGSGKPVTIKTVVKEISSIVGLGKPLFGDIPYREYENMELFPDVLKAKQILNWSAKTELREGLIKTIDAFRYE